MTVKELYQKLDERIPKELSCDWDNDGLMCCPEPEREVRRVLLSLDATEGAIREAIAGGCDVILTHHPLIFRPLRALVDPRLVTLIRHGIAVMSFHTRLDRLDGGVNDTLAAVLGVSVLGRFGEDDLGVIGTVTEEMSPEAFAAAAKKALGAPFAEAVLCRSIKRVALVGGDGKDYLDAARAAGADTYVTGSMSYNTLTDAVGTDINVGTDGNRRFLQGLVYHGGVNVRHPVVGICLLGTEGDHVSLLYRQIQGEAGGTDDVQRFIVAGLLRIHIRALHAEHIGIGRPDLFTVLVNGKVIRDIVRSRRLLAAAGQLFKIKQQAAAIRCGIVDLVHVRIGLCAGGEGDHTRMGVKTATLLGPYVRARGNNAVAIRRRGKGHEGANRAIVHTNLPVVAEYRVVFCIQGRNALKKLGYTNGNSISKYHVCIKSCKRDGRTGLCITYAIPIHIPAAEHAIALVNRQNGDLPICRDHIDHHAVFTDGQILLLRAYGNLTGDLGHGGCLCVHRAIALI